MPDHRTGLLICSYPLDNGKATANRIKPFIEYFLSTSIEIICISPPKDLDTTLSEVLWHLKQFFFVFRRSRNIDFCLISIPSIWSIFFHFAIPPRGVIFDFRDEVWTYLIRSNNGFECFLGYVFRWIVKKLVSKAQLVLCANKSIMDDLKGTAGKLIYLPNGISRDMHTRLCRIPTSSALNVPTKVLYAGNVGRAQDLILMVRLAALFPEVEFWIVGSGKKLNEIVTVVDSLELNNVHFLNLVSKDKLVQLYCEATVVFGNIQPQFDGALPTKLFEYLVTGKRVLFGGRFPEIDYLVSKCDHVVLVPERSLEHFAVGLESLLRLTEVDGAAVAKIRRSIGESYLRERIVEENLGFYF